MLNSLLDAEIILMLTFKALNDMEQVYLKDKLDIQRGRYIVNTIYNVCDSKNKIGQTWR